MRFFSEPTDQWLSRGCILCVPRRAQITRTLVMKHCALVLMSQAPVVNDRGTRGQVGRLRVAAGAGRRALPGFGQLTGAGAQAIEVPRDTVVVMDTHSPGE